MQFQGPKSSFFLLPLVAIMGIGCNFSERELVIEQGPSSPQQEALLEVLSKDDPCYSYATNTQIEVLASCREIIDGQDNSKASYEIESAHLCILKKSFDAANVQVLSVVGSFEARDKRNDKLSRINLDLLSVPTEGEDGLILRGDENSRTEVTILGDWGEVQITQRTKLWRKLLRSARISCETLDLNR
jgi:hypothetical protein